ncbi:hypothetical protein A3J17_03825 [Candidatus Curtissbacteria bacterium RIFCSPLOWO2_02_FULL_40_11]|uniref:Uncharacterized protein n=2 Tax=Candidatus Curtissiibacteriota TaxID=1752717 RepID=A0A1F5G9C2_9BACT|nr:MAG: hypothetical protein A3D04_01090 [Candidatus Curtissbacteria bacterium RIFCSPHIGHO2_02_FULL_40_16b]OGE00239.1 MAG: hypothetical protein A3J17_03825 [Candidatus Curtissbacteria bacterium RIFCSPLOWO2_02_FULL_40_11]OGE14004.1 MAG: hypothetical protein A3G14_03720 [Candidatus Curtissbacteria bacterium RIFCSPLOWO2_12_FULL_38_9]
MNKKLPIAIVVIVLITFLLLVYLFFFQKQVIAPTDIFETASTNQPLPAFEASDEILKNALNLYSQKKQEGQDFSSGPCLGQIAEDWVLDIAHNPRLEVDDKPQNQCADFREGRVKHFIELDPEGKLIKAQ